MMDTDLLEFGVPTAILCAVREAEDMLEWEAAERDREMAE